MNIYIVTKGAFKGYEGTLCTVAGVLHLQSINGSDNWDYVLVTKDQIEFLCTIDYL